MTKYKLTITSDDSAGGSFETIYVHNFGEDEGAARAVIRHLCKPARKPRKGKSAPVPQAELPSKPVKGGAF